MTEKVEKKDDGVQRHDYALIFSKETPTPLFQGLKEDLRGAGFVITERKLKEGVSG